MDSSDIPLDLDDDHTTSGHGDITTQDAIIDVLAHLHPPPPSAEDHSLTGAILVEPSSAVPLVEPTLDIDETTPASDGLDGWRNKELRLEIVRLREILMTYGHTDLTPPPRQAKKRKRSLSIATPASDSLWPTAEEKKPRQAVVVKDEETGKRVAKDRRLELSKAIRKKMRAVMGMAEDGPLPAPSSIHASQDTSGVAVPNWLDTSDSLNTVWTEKIATELLEESKSGQHDKIPVEDLDLEVIKNAAKTAFINFSKRYMSENDPQQASKKERFQKTRRRWSRKDTKQRKRAKAALDPSLTMTIPPIALHLDYMSSECSSPGEDSEGEEIDDGTKLARSHRWAQQIAIKAAQAPPVKVDGKEWGQSQGEKVLEIRTPRWRSHALSEIYTKLDEIAAGNSKARAGPSRKASTLTPKSGYIAPTHSRFTMYGSLARKGKAPKADGEAWMWKSGQVGEWPPVEVDMPEPFYGVSLGNDGDWRAVESDALVQALEGIPSDHVV